MSQEDRLKSRMVYPSETGEAFAGAERTYASHYAVLEDPRSMFHWFARNFLCKPITLGAALLLSVGLLLGSATDVQAATGINRQINYQAKLLNDAGAAVVDGTYNIKFNIYDTPTVGTDPIWTASGTLFSPTALQVTVASGLFTIALGDTSAEGGTQNALSDAVLWNTDGLYLGITIEADSEMTPRKRLMAVPQAFNSEMLQGMYASSSAADGTTLFTINQTSTSTATGARSALDVRSSGANDDLDFIMRGIDATGTAVFHVKKTGSAYATGLETNHLNATGSRLDIIPTDVARLRRTASTSTGYFSGYARIRTFGRYTYVLGPDTDTVTVFDTSASSTPLMVATTSTRSTYPVDIYVSGRYAYIPHSTTGDITIFDVSNPARMYDKVGVITGLAAGSIAGQGKYLYVGQVGALKVLDISNPLAPVLLSTYSLFGYNPTVLKPLGTRLFVGSSGDTTTYLLDISDPQNVTQLDSVTGYVTGDIAVNGRYAYALEYNGTNASIFDIANPSDIQIAGTFTVSSASPAFNSLAISGRYLYVALSSGMVVYDMENPRYIRKLGEFDPWSAQMLGFSVVGRKAHAVVFGAPYLFDTVDLGGLETNALLAHAAELGNTYVRGNVDISEHLQVSGGLNVGEPGIMSSGALAVSAIGSTSTILGNLLIGTSTKQIIMNSMFSINGDDLFVGGNIGSATSVYTNGEFIVGAASTKYGDGYIWKTDGGFSVTSTGDLALSSVTGNMYLSPGGGYILPTSDLLFAFGREDLRFDAYLGNSTSTNATTTNFAVLGSMTLGGQTLSAWPSGGGGAGGGWTTSTDNLVTHLATGVNAAVLGGIATTTDYALFEVLGDAYVSENINVTGTAFLTDTYTTTLGVTTTTSSYLTVSKNAAFLPISGSTSVASSTTSLIDATPNMAVTQGKYTFVTYSSTDQLAIYERTSTSSAYAFVTSTYSGGDMPVGVYVNGHYAYVTNENSGTLGIIDISNIASSTLVSTVTLGSVPRFVTGNGRYLITADANVRIFDLANGASPRLLSTWAIPLGNMATGLALQGKYLYVGDGSANQIHVLNIASPYDLSLKSTYTSPDTMATRGLAIQGRYLYVNDGNIAALGVSGVRILDASDDSNLVEINRWIGAEGGCAALYGCMQLAGGYLHLALNANYRVFDVRSPMGLELVDSVLTPDGGSYRLLNVSGGRFGLTMTAFGMFTLDFGGIETANMTAYNTEVGQLNVTQDGRIANTLNVGNGVSVGQGGVYSLGGFSGGTTSTTSTIFGNLAVGTSTIEVTMDPNFFMDGDDLFVQGNIGSATSIYTNGVFTSANLDLAEEYQIRGTAEPGDVLVMDSVSSTTVTKSTGVAYDPKTIGVVSTSPGVLLGRKNGASVALVGRVPVKFSLQNGPISIGDPLAASSLPGFAMKATKPGMIIGRALENANTTSTVVVFINAQYYAGSLLATDGTVAQVTDDLVMAPRAVTSAENPTADSWGLTFRGSAWNGTSAISSDFILANTVTSVATSSFTIKNASTTTLLALDQDGTATIKQDLVIGGKLYPSARGTIQQDKYIYLDDSLSPTTTYMATNADGWQANSSYDFAERYYSPDKLEPGDLVVVSQRGRIHVQRASEPDKMLIGIVSTKPGFVAGAAAPSTHPIALVGRVPTKVSTLKGAIQIGDMLAPSTIPGVAVKAVEAGPVVGQALEDFSGNDIGLVEAYVNPVWWGGDKSVQLAAAEAVADAAAPVFMPQRGFAIIISGATRVHVSFPSVGGYPNVQATPRGEVEGGWWTDNYTDTGFDIVMKQEQTRDIAFTWRVDPTGVDEKVYASDGTSASVDPTTGFMVNGTQTKKPAPEPVVDPAPEPEDIAVTPTSATTTQPAQPTPVVEPEPPQIVPVAEEPVAPEPAVVEPLPVIEPVPTPVVEPVPTPPEPTPEPTPVVEPAVPEPVVVPVVTEAPLPTVESTTTTE